MKKQFGFSLIELLVVVSIIGVLASIVTVNVNSVRKQSRDAKRIADLSSIQGALEMYYSQNREYPKFEAGWAVSPGYEANWQSLQSQLSPYISKLPADPSPNRGEHQYQYYSDNGKNYVLLMYPEDASLVSKGDGCLSNPPNWYCIGNFKLN